MAKKKLIAFDMDGVLTKHPSSWSYVHKYFGVNNSSNMALYRSGKISYSSFMAEDVKLWLSRKSPISGAEIVDLMKKIPLMDNLYPGLELLRKRGYVISIVSGGLSCLSDIIAQGFRFDRIFSNSIDLDSKGNLVPSGRVGVIPEKKNLAIIEMQDDFGIGVNDTISVGDSDFDVSMFDASGFRVAYNPRNPKVVSAADLILYSHDFLDLVERITKRIE
ncbi:MAG: HAD-IB family phosphatase [Thermoplasmata archaeon]